MSQLTRDDDSARALILPDRAISRGELLRAEEACASFLASAGISRGDVVALQVPKRLETYALWLACLRLRCIYVFMDPRNPAQRTRATLDRVKPSLLVTSGDARNPYGGTLQLA